MKIEDLTVSTELDSQAMFHAIGGVNRNLKNVGAAGSDMSMESDTLWGDIADAMTPYQFLTLNSWRKTETAYPESTVTAIGT